MKKQICKECGKQYNKINRKNTCSPECYNRFHSKETHYKLRGSKRYIKMKKKHMKDWYEVNKERQLENVMRNYRLNKWKWKLRDFANRNKAELTTYLLHKCVVCGAKGAKMFTTKNVNEHTKVPDLMSLKCNKPQRELEMKEYAKSHLDLVCNRNCLGRLRWKKK